MSKPTRRALRRLQRQLDEGMKDTDIIPIGGLSVRKKDADEVHRIVGKIADLVRTAARDTLANEKDMTNLAAYAAQTASAYAEASVGRPLWACRKGCAHCCHHWVDVSMPEALLIAQAVRESLPTEQLDALLLVLRERAAVARGASNPLAYTALRQRCAFLNDDNSCAAYQVRPIVCRAFASFDRDSCARQLAAPGKAKIMQDNGALFQAGAVSAGLREAITEAHLDGALYELHAAVLACLETPDAEQRWRAGEKLMESR